MLQLILDVRQLGVELIVTPSLCPLKGTVCGHKLRFAASATYPGNGTAKYKKGGRSSSTFLVLGGTIPKDKSRPRKAQTFTDLSGLGNLKPPSFRMFRINSKRYVNMSTILFLEIVMAKLAKTFYYP